MQDLELQRSNLVVLYIQDWRHISQSSFFVSKKFNYYSSQISCLSIKEKILIVLKRSLLGVLQLSQNFCQYNTLLKFIEIVKPNKNRFSITFYVKNVNMVKSRIFFKMLVIQNIQTVLKSFLNTLSYVSNLESEVAVINGFLTSAFEILTKSQQFSSSQSKTFVLKNIYELKNHLQRQNYYQVDRKIGNMLKSLTEKNGLVFQEKEVFQAMKRIKHKTILFGQKQKIPESEKREQ